MNTKLQPKSCNQLQWPLWQIFWIAIVLISFWLAKAHFSYTLGNKAYFHTDETTEQVSMFAAKYHVEHGFFKNYLLPTFPPLGVDNEGKNISKPFVYTHYIGFPDLLLGLWLKVVGFDSIWTGRLLPLTLTTLVLLWLTFEFAAYVRSSLAGCIFLSLLMIPRSLTSWSTAFHGYGYVMAFYLALIAGLLAIQNKKKFFINPKTQWAFGFLIGFLQLGFELDWFPVTFIAALSFTYLLPNFDRSAAKRVCLGILLGGCVTFTYQTIICSLYYGSFWANLSDLFTRFTMRTGIPKDGAILEGVSAIDLRFHRLFKEFDRQAYGATGWTTLNMLFLSFLFIFLGLMTRIKTTLETRRLFFGVVLAFIGTFFWTLIVKQHAFVHLRFINRHSIVLYVTLLFISFSVCMELIRQLRYKQVLSQSQQ